MKAENEIEITTESQQKTKLELPVFVKDAVHYWKIISDDVCICVKKKSPHVFASIELMETDIALKYHSDTSSVEEFKKAFDETMDEIFSNV